MKYLIFAFSCLLLVQCDTIPLGFPGTNYPKTPVYKNNNASESEEFAALMEKDKIDRNQRTAEVLSRLLNDEDPKDRLAAVVIDNNTDCNIIVRIVGNKVYNLPIPKNGKNYLMVEKGDYTLKSYLCNSTYYTQKSIQETLTFTLSEHSE